MPCCGGPSRTCAPLAARTTDIRIWALDHGQREPVTAEERKRGTPP